MLLHIIQRTYVEAKYVSSKTVTGTLHWNWHNNIQQKDEIHRKVIVSLLSTIATDIFPFVYQDFLVLSPLPNHNSYSSSIVYIKSFCFYYFKTTSGALRFFKAFTFRHTQIRYSHWVPIKDAAKASSASSRVIHVLLDIPVSVLRKPSGVQHGIVFNVLWCFYHLCFLPSTRIQYLNWFTIRLDCSDCCRKLLCRKSRHWTMCVFIDLFLLPSVRFLSIIHGTTGIINAMRVNHPYNQSPNKPPTIHSPSWIIKSQGPVGHLSNEICLNNYNFWKPFFWHHKYPLQFPGLRKKRVTVLLSANQPCSTALRPRAQTRLS